MNTSKKYDRFNGVNTQILNTVYNSMQNQPEKCLVGLNAITKEAWETAQQTEDKREKIQALSLAKDCYSMKLDLLTNATVVDDAIKFISSNKSKDKIRSFSSNEYDKEESNEHRETSHTTITTNEVF
jgi:hypothetical protein